VSVEARVGFETKRDIQMISQFFEINVAAGQQQQYLDLAASLKPKLDAMGGCLFLDRYKSLKRENVLLSYQVWRDEGSMTAWRVNSSHHDVQVAGREKVFADYRIRIAQIIHETRPRQPAWEPPRLTPYNDPARRPPTYVLATESKNAELPVTTDWRGDSFASVYRDGHFAHLIDVPDRQSGLELGPKLFADPSTEYFRIFEVMRDYGMYDRKEAPQYYPDVKRGSA
jgi:heme-degrading monooxygenase HmoA